MTTNAPTVTVGFTDDTLTENRRARQIKNRMTNRLTKRLNLYVRSIAITKNPQKLAVLKGKAEAIQFAIDTLKAV